MIFGDFLINFRIIHGKYCINYEKNSWEFWYQLVVLEVFWWNFEKTAKKMKEFNRNWEKKF